MFTSIEAKSINVTQIALPLSFGRHFSFDNFITKHADFVVASLKSLLASDTESIIGLWGGAHSGKTHLLNACALFAREQSSSFQFYDGYQLVDCDPTQFDEFDRNTLLIIDNLDAVCGNRDWEAFFYGYINQCRDLDRRLIFSLSSKPQDLSCVLPDFQSRLSWGLLLELAVPGDVEIEHIIESRARLLGLTLSKEVLAYLLSHFSRRLSDQIQLLRKLDAVSLSAQKKITIPFIKQVLNAS
jgi:DnaA family protein